MVLFYVLGRASKMIKPSSRWTMCPLEDGFLQSYWDSLPR